MLVNLLVEGLVDEALGRKLLACSGHEPGITFGKRGWTYIEQKAQAFDRSCASNGVLTLVDFMDTKLQCPVAVLKRWLPHQSQSHIFRVVVREIESWLLADREAVAGFLNISIKKVPIDPESIPDPKRALINLARTSRTGAIRYALVPQEGYSSSEGPLYSSEMTRFISEYWRPEAAASHARSLAACLNRLQDLHRKHADGA